MCDYSLINVASRPAKVGDVLTISSFPETFTRGFAEVGKPGVAVCLLPGTEVAFDKDVTQGTSGFVTGFVTAILFGNTSLGNKVGRFRQINTDQPCVHHDALEFPDGQVVLISSLSEGQRAKVLQLPPQPKTAAEAEAQQVLDVVG